MKQIFTLLVAVFAFQQSTLAQRVCGTTEYQMMLEQEDPSIINRLEEIEQFTRDYLLSNPQGERALVTIPVVVHVVYNTTAENISDAQIQSQINVLNQDFRKLNADVANTPGAFAGLASDSNIEFCLATVDPNGNPTNGVLRVPTTATSFGTNNTVKSSTSGGSNAWNAGKYLNMWVCDISGGTLGYAQFPGGSASTDGVVIDYQYFGTLGTATAPFNKGRTATHEVGHWLNLRHIWGDDGTGCTGSDQVTDTPNAAGPNYGCPAFPTVTCSNGPNGDMFMNYMDYTDDACMFMFSSGQVSRMQALFATGGARASLLTSNGCGTAGPAPTCNDGVQNGTETGIDCGGSCAPCPCNGTSLTLAIIFDNYPAETAWNIRNSANAIVASGGPYSGQTANSTLNVPICLGNDCYTLTFTDTYGDGMCCTYGNGSYRLIGPSGTLVSGGTFTTSQATQFCVGSTPAPTCTDGIQNGNETGIDCGGSCAPCVTPCTVTTVNSNNFEAGLGIWTDGGTDCARISGTTSPSGTWAIRLRDNTSSSVMSTTNINLANYNEITVSFKFRTVSFENGEDFWVQLSTNGGTSYTTRATYVAGTGFANNTVYSVNVVIPGPFTSTTRVRFRADASDDDDALYIDDVVITGCVVAAREEEANASIINNSVEAISAVNIYPNPVADALYIDYLLAESGTVEISVLDLQGRVIEKKSQDLQEGMQHQAYDTQNLAAGTYLLMVSNNGQRSVKRFMVQR